MKLRTTMVVVALLAVALATTACGSEQDGQGKHDKATSKQVTMDEEQATKRAEEIIHQAVDGMSPKPTLKRSGPVPVGPCVADDHGSDDRLQLSLSYDLTGVPGSAAKKLVRQARDAWVKQGYTFQDSDEDWSKPFPKVNMRTEPDDFWMDAVTGVVDRAKGEGLASIGVTSPCFAPAGEPASKADSAALYSAPAADDPGVRRALDHSSRIYDALRVRHTTQGGTDGVRVVRDADGTWLHHDWSTDLLTTKEAADALGRAQTYFESANWTVRRVATDASVPALFALHEEDKTVAQLVPSAEGMVRVAVTTPAAHVTATDI
ncbi:MULTISPECIES: hypothetical protein [Streptomyces]|uniref:hypothetical protein n=1 Tax=Streptomyces TaxID=1883 RepID=UPI0007677D46|nr:MULTISPECIES: hypothetical protein [Streptomyces]MDN3053483.1 hypothetical protein [Streptomyces sp. SRF1]